MVKFLELFATCTRMLNHVSNKMDHNQIFLIVILGYGKERTSSRFRASNYKLPIVVHRFNGRLRSERLCELCNLKDLGDEYHYLMKCNFFQSQNVNILKGEHIQRGKVLSRYETCHEQ